MQDFLGTRWPAFLAALQAAARADAELAVLLGERRLQIPSGGGRA